MLNNLPSNNRIRVQRELRDQGERHGLKRVEHLAAAGKIKKVLVHEVSRLARKNSVTHRFVVIGEPGKGWKKYRKQGEENNTP